MQAEIRPMFPNKITAKTWTIAILLSIGLCWIMVSALKRENNNSDYNLNPIYGISADTTKPLDSISLQKRADKYIDSLITNTSLKQFGNWLYKNVSGEVRDTYTYDKLYNIFLNQQYNLRFQPKK